jgi:hypothetical protein
MYIVVLFIYELCISVTTSAWFWMFPVSLICANMIAQSGSWLGCGLDDQQIMVWFPAESEDLCLLQSIQTGSGIHPAPFSVGSENSLIREWGDQGVKMMALPSSAKVKCDCCDTCCDTVVKRFRESKYICFIPISVTEWETSYSYHTLHFNTEKRTWNSPKSMYR